MRGHHGLVTILPAISPDEVVAPADAHALCITTGPWAGHPPLPGSTVTNSPPIGAGPQRDPRRPGRSVATRRTARRSVRFEQTLFARPLTQRPKSGGHPCFAQRGVYSLR